MNHSKPLRLLTAQNFLLGIGIGIVVSHDPGDTRFIILGTVFTVAGAIIWIVNAKNIKAFLKDVEESS